MIVQTTRISREGGVRYLARHLLDKVDENELIEVLAGDRGALYDAQTLAQAKGCRYSIRHLSISPEREMTAKDLGAFLRSLDQEFGIGLDRPRLVVRHVKNGRSHFHVAIAEVDPSTWQVLDCRQDFSRIERLARQYELEHGESLQQTRSERRLKQIEGFSDTARKRAERNAPMFDRTALRKSFASGAVRLRAELQRQGLIVKQGHKCPILIRADGKFVAAAHRACGVRKRVFMEALQKAPIWPRTAAHNRTSNSSRTIDVPRRRPSDDDLRNLTKFDPDELLRRAQELARAFVSGLWAKIESLPAPDQQASGARVMSYRPKMHESKKDGRNG